MLTDEDTIQHSRKKNTKGKNMIPAVQHKQKARWIWNDDGNAPGPAGIGRRMAYKSLVRPMSTPESITTSTLAETNGETINGRH